VAGLTSTLTSVTTGGLACIAGVGVIMLAFPDLAAYDGGSSPAADLDAAKAPDGDVSGARPAETQSA
jgi:hypothetical protein